MICIVVRSDFRDAGTDSNHYLELGAERVGIFGRSIKCLPVGGSVFLTGYKLLALSEAAWTVYKKTRRGDQHSVVVLRPDLHQRRSTGDTNSLVQTQYYE